jgi:DNA-binding CsgD family transcriptional regulator
LLAYIGITEEHRFHRRQLAILRALAAPLRERLLLERRLHDARFATAAIDAVLEAIAVPAVLVVGRTIHSANASARQAFAAESRAWVWQDCQVTRLAGFDAELRIRRSAIGDPAPRITIAARHWGLTPREREVLALVARGATNVRIANELGCAEATVEIHVSRLLAKADVDNRAALVAALWELER